MAAFLQTLKRIYLSIYNWTVCIGWCEVLYLALKTLRDAHYTAVYDAVERPLQLAQTAAFLEVCVAAPSFLPLVLDFNFSFLPLSADSPRSCRLGEVSATLPQIGSRLYVTWGILWSFPETRTHILVTSLVISWSITEIIRYSFFGRKETLGFTPSWLLWLRYSTFLVLYPTGITSEIGLIYAALPYIKASEKYCIRMPNKWNYSFDYFYTAIVVLGIYVPGTPHMYTYMLGQRKKALSKAKTA